MKKQTAVEFLIQYMMNNQYFVGNDLADVFEQAKQMEKEQIIKAASVVLWNNSSNSIEAAEQYYNETYKGGSNE